MSQTFQKVFQVKENNPHEVKVTQSLDTSQFSLFAQLKPGWLALKTLGLLPTFSAQPTEASAPKKNALIYVKAGYAVGVHLAFGALGIRAVMETALNVFSKDSLTMPFLISEMVLVAVVIPQLIIAPLHWARIGHVMRFIADWDELQAQFLKVTRHPLELNMHRLTSVTIILVLVVTILGCVAMDIDLLIRETYLNTVFFIFAMAQINVLLAVWVLICHASAQAAGQLARRLTEEFQNPGSVDEHAIYNYHRVWLRLSQLTRDIGTMYSSVFNVILFTWLIEMLLSCFACVAFLIDGCSLGLVFGQAVFAITALVSVQIFCNAASHATEAIRGKFLRSLVLLVVDKSEVRKQLQDFELAVSVHAADISLGGYCEVNKSLVVSIMSAFTTFLVVIFQTSTSTDSFCNATNVSKPNETQVQARV